MYNLAKILGSKSELIAVSKLHRDEGLTIVNGTFDLLHPGHLNLLQYARSLSYPLLVLVNSDDSIRRLKGENRPLIDQKNRVYMLASLRFVDYIYVFDEDRITKYFSIIRPKVWVKGSDYINSIEQSELNEANKYNVKIQFCPRNEFSSSDLIQKIIKTIE